jgi:hypothetical protein
MGHDTEAEIRARIAELESTLTEIYDRSADLRRAPAARMFSRARRSFLLLALLVALPLVAYAANISTPYTFVNGTVADAVEVNANFATLVAESNAQDERVTALEALPNIQIRSSTVSVSTTGTTGVGVSCSPGEQVIGGGFDPQIALVVHGSYPLSSTQWECVFTNPASSARDATCYAICADFG